MAPLARAGIPIVGLEPSCLLTLRDEALVMGLGEPAQAVAAQALLFEEFIAREVKAGRFALPLRAAFADFRAQGITEVIIDFGGFLGMGTSQVSLGFDELTILADEGRSDVRVYVDATKEQIQAQPEYRAAN